MFIGYVQSMKRMSDTNAFKLFLDYMLEQSEEKKIDCFAKNCSENLQW